MIHFKRLISMLALFALAACGGGGGSAGTSNFSGGGSSSSGGGTTTKTPTLSLALSNTTVSSAAPVTVTATVATASGTPVPGIVVTFSTKLGLGSFSSTTALTNANGVATVTLSPAAATSSGADTAVATATVSSTALSGSAGFSLVATTASITSFTTATTNSAANPLSAYGQIVLQVNLSGVSSASPVTLTVASACVSAGKATISPSTITATSSPVTLTYNDTGGCGSTLASDTLTASISGTSAQAQLPLYLSSPLANNIVFVSATPQTIYLANSGLTTSAQVVFQVNDANNNPLPGQVVTTALSTSVGGLSTASPSTQTTNSAGRVTVIVNSGTIPTPVRVTASVQVGTSTISTVSSSLSVAVGLPSEINFSLSQKAINIEGYNRDGTTNSYTIIASDRLGNPVPDGTAINFISEGGQVQSNAFTATSNGLSSATANFQTSNPRPADGRVTVLAYAQGEKSFVDPNGSNVYVPGDQFQDLGNPYLDTLFNGVYASSAANQTIAQSNAGTLACSTGTAAQLQYDVSIPTQPNTCTGVWGSAYVRRAVETIFSTSAASLMWGTSWPAGSVEAAGSCPSGVSLIQPNQPPLAPAYNADGSANKQTYYPFGGAQLYVANASGIFAFYVSDANPVAFNPMAAGTTIGVSGTSGLTVTLAGGSPVPDTNVPSAVAVNYSFATGTVNGTATVTISSPSGLQSTFTQFIQVGAAPANYTVCSPAN